MPFLNCAGPLPGMHFGFPDVCLTPSPVGPVPLPYPNIAMTPTSIPNQTKVTYSCMPGHNVATVTPLSNGDNAGVSGGVASGTVMGPARATMGSFKVTTCGVPAAKFILPTIQNSTNAPGLTLVPSQIRVMALA